MLSRDTSRLRRFPLLLAILFLFGAAAPAHGAAFTPGNLVVVRVGEGAAALSTAATPVFLDEYTTAGALVQSIPLLTTVNGVHRRATLSGTATSEGFLNLSANEQYLLLGGYDADPGTAGVSSTASATVNRVIARIDLDANIDTTTALTDAYTGNSFRSATSADGQSFWTAGNSGSTNGVRYVSSLGGATSTRLSTDVLNTRVVNLHGGQLYVSSGSGTFLGVSTVGTGMPTTSGQNIVLIAGYTGGTHSAYDYFFADANTLYLADDGTVGAGGGIQKWTNTGGGFQLRYTIAMAGTRGLTGVIAEVPIAGETQVTLYATAAGNTLYTVVDTLSDIVGPAPAPNTIATAAANTALRGVRALPCIAPTITAQPEALTVCLDQKASFTVAAAGSATVTYQWRRGATDLVNGGNISGANSATLVIDPAGPGDDADDYSVLVSNNCGSIASAEAALTVQTCSCAGDVNGDSTVDVNDLLLLIGAWGATGPNDADINGDLVVDVNDLLALIGAWGPCG